MNKNIAVITPVFNPNPQWLEQCIKSVELQSLPCCHILVVDGEHTLDFVNPNDRLKIIRLPESHRDFGDTPRAIGSISAFRLGFDAVAWLDYDNWFEKNHLESLVQLEQKMKSGVCCSSRKIFDSAGSELGICPESGDNFIDTNCYLISKSERALCSLWWLMDEDCHKVGDRVFLNYLQSRNIAIARTELPTLCYRSNFEAHYHFFGKTPPPGAKPSF